MAGLRRFIAGSGAERSAAPLALAMAPKLSLRGTGYRRTAGYLHRVALKGVPDLEMAVERGSAAHGAMRGLPFEMTCLERSLVKKTSPATSTRTSSITTNSPATTSSMLWPASASHR